MITNFLHYTAVLYSLHQTVFRLIVLCNGNNWTEYLDWSRTEECNFNALYPHPSCTSPLASEKVEVSTECCILHGWLVMSNTFNSNITQHQMFLIEKQNAFKSVGRRFPLSHHDSRDIKICILFLMPGLNTGLCQFSSPKSLFRDLEQKEREIEKREQERSSGFTAAGPAQP